MKGAINEESVATNNADFSNARFPDNVISFLYSDPAGLLLFLTISLDLYSDTYNTPEHLFNE